MSTRPSARGAGALCAALVFVSVLPAQGSTTLRPLAQDRAKGAAAVTEAMCRDWLGTLASPEYGGRGTGQPGYELAAVYVRDHFQQLGLEPAFPEGSYWQALPWNVTEPKAEGTHLRLTHGGKAVVDLGLAELAGTATQEIEAKGDVVLVVVRDLEGNDLAGADLSDKIVLVHAPAGLVPKGQAGRRGNAALFRLQSALQQARARLTVFCDDELFAATGKVQGASVPGGGGANRAMRGRDRRPVSLTVRTSVLEKALAAAGKTLENVAAHAGLVDLAGLQADVAVKVETRQGPAYNVAAILPGSDPARRDEYVVMGSHLDHLGQRGATLFPGADDDASGSTGLMAVAAMWARNPVKPARSLLFVAFTGEEMGLLGSNHFVENPPIPLGSIVAELQMDMIGRDEEGQDESADANRNTLHLVGTERLSRSLHELCLARNEQHFGFALEYDEEDVFSRSDHANFARKGIPIAFFFTGFHRDYHQQSDTPDKIHYAKLLKVATYVYDLSFELAQAKGRPLVDPDLWEKSRKGLGRNVPEKPVAPLAPAKGG